MPIVSSFYGIYILLYFNDHEPAHFHARYGEYRAVFLLDSLMMIEGQMPARAMRLIQEWATLHREELLEAWKACRAGRPPGKIAPLT